MKGRERGCQSKRDRRTEGEGDIKKRERGGRERDIRVERARLIYLHVENDHTDHNPGGAGQPEEQVLLQS